MITDLILENESLFKIFKDRFNELNIGYDQLLKEMEEDHIVMDKKRLQRFLLHGFQKRITQKAYIWLLMRHGIYVSLKVKGSNNTEEQNRNNAKQFSR